MKYTFYTNFAATYDCNTYGSGSYNSAGACTTASGNNGLSTTGTNVALGVGGGLVLIALAVVLFMMLRRGKRSAPKQ